MISYPKLTLAIGIGIFVGGLLLAILATGATFYILYSILSGVAETFSQPSMPTPIPFNIPEC